MRARIVACRGEFEVLREPDDFVPLRAASYRDSEGNGFELRRQVDG